MLHGIINVPVTDLRAEPDEKSERLSQVIFGTPVQIGELQKKFSRIALPDKYNGWCRTGHIHQIGFALWQKYVAQPKQKVKAEIVLVKGVRGIPAFPFRLYFGTELVIKQHNGEVHFELPPGDIRAPISTHCLTPPENRRRAGVIGKKLVSTASRFLGVPYLWGGITPAGFDCSGLVQTVYGFHGLVLPRDSKDQRDEGISVGRDELQPGDLVFFPGHVGISCGGDEILHASAGRGMVAVDSLNPKAPSYRQDLDKEFEFARRLPL